VLGDLADQNQAVLYVQLWRLRDGRLGWEPAGDSWAPEIDFSASWEEIVAQTRARSASWCAAVSSDGNLFAQPEGIDRSDL
jgi:hypothetical protein